MGVRTRGGEQVTLEELKEYLKANATEDDIIDVLGLTIDHLVEQFDYLIVENFDEVLSYFDLDEEDYETDL